MGSPHPRQRPRSVSHEAMGMLSNQAMPAPHLGQRERGRTTDSSLGQREMHTFKNDPTAEPIAKVKTAMKGLTGAGRKG